MKIWVDADACPVAIKEMLFRAADREAIEVTFVANQHIPVPRSKFITMIQVHKGFNIADNEIAQRVQPDDLVVTQDIPLAADVIEKGALAMSPRGTLHTAGTIKARLTMRNFMETMRNAGVQTSGPPPLSQQDKQAFGNQLDKWLQTRRSNQQKQKP
jgi:uncharacterized protein YaiI (UPF0178 family)